MSEKVGAMTHTFKSTTVAVFTAAMMATLPMAAQAVQADAQPATNTIAVDGSYETAGTNGMDRRGDRRDDRQDCRDGNGAVGKDKRDCKQDARQG